MMRKNMIALTSALSALLLGGIASAQSDYDTNTGSTTGAGAGATVRTPVGGTSGSAGVNANQQSTGMGGDIYGMGGDVYGMGGQTYGTLHEDMTPAPKPYTYEETQPSTVKVEEHQTYATRWGMAIMAGGGVTDFTDNDIQDATDVGGTWDARLAIGTESLIGLEAAYVGEASGMNALGLDTNAVLLGNGAEALARLNIGTFAVQPFLFGGAAWIHYDITNSDVNTSDFNDSDDVFGIPFGAGLAGHISGLYVDGRFTYEPTFDEDLVNTNVNFNNNDTSLDSWKATARVGYEF